jgi:transcriptional regulator with GAF, ATPase, and Fis domain
LFGHVRGAFTGAVADKIGLFEAADGGTLLLDEVGEMTPRAQVKLLRILELGEVRRVGETRTRQVRVRVIAATNADLRAQIDNGGFRRDLFYRLCGLRVDLPPLRRRMGDVPLLAGHFVRLFGNHDGPPPGIAPEAIDRLLQHSWPGNVRELRFAIERAVAMTRAIGRERIEADCVDVEPAGSALREAAESEPLPEALATMGLEATIENLERRLILRALEQSGWNRTRAARILGNISRTTLIGKMKRLGLFPADCGEEEQRVSAS